MQFSVLGPLQVSNGSDVVDVGGPRQRRLLAALIAGADEVVSSDRLIEIVFEQDPPEGAAATLRTYVARLRKALSEDEGAITTRAPGYGFVSDGHRIDALQFAAEAEAGHEQLADDPVGAISTLQQALGLWHGLAYEEFTYEDWARPEIDHLDELRIGAQEDLVEARLACGMHQEAIPELRRLVQNHPLREKLTRQLVIALYRSGRQAEALRAAEDYRHELAEVGLEPSGELTALERNVASHDPALHLAQPAGQPLHGYRLGKLIGQGAHGVVYEGIQPGVGREVAVKAIKSDLIDEPGFIRRFDVEAQLVAHLEHPHIVPVYDFWREPGGAYLVMRRLHGNLEDELADGPLDTVRVADLAKQLGSALSTAHEAGVVHGDLKPSNVLLDGEGNAYLSDFGVATLIGQQDVSGGSPTSGYESPEVISGEAPQPASDQFALAVLLAQALTGSPAFGKRAIAGPQDRMRSVHAFRPAVPAAVDEVLWRGTAWLPGDRLSDVMSFVSGFVSAIEGHDTEVTFSRSTVNPFKGLRSFDEPDAPDFFGREQSVAEVIQRLSGDDPASRFVTVIGASGSGKSSIVRAGVLPALRRSAIPGSDRWLIATLVPGADPFASLAAALRRVASREPELPADEPAERWFEGLVRSAIPDHEPVLIVLDQMEEMFTLVDSSTRNSFLTGLTDAIETRGPNLRVIATLRADFFHRPLETPVIGGWVKRGGVAVIGMTADQLNEAIVEPAARAGVEIEPALAAHLASEVVSQPASLPLLQFTLRELFQSRTGPVITLDSYRSMGGLEAAIADQAEHVYSSLPKQRRSLVGPLFLRLVTVSDDGAPTRRRILRSALGTSVIGTSELVDTFTSARLLTVDADPATREPTVELAHEALISHWPRLRGWVTEAGEDLITQSRLAEASQTWDAQGRDGSDLYRGAKLETTVAWAKQHQEEMTPVERDFLEGSVALAEAEEAREREHAERQEKTNTRLRRLVAGIGATLVVALIAGFLAVGQRNQAREEQARASIVSLVSASSVSLDTDPQLGLLLAIEAAETMSDASLDMPTVEQALHDALAANREIFNEPNHDNGLAHISPTGEHFVALTHPDDASILQVWSMENLEPVRELTGHKDSIIDAVFSPDGTLIATTSEDDTVRIWDVATGGEVHVLTLGAEPSIPVFSNDGTLLAANTFESEVWIWDVVSGERVATLLPSPELRAGSTLGLNLEFSPDDSLLAAVFNSAEGDVVVWEVATAEESLVINHDGSVLDLGFGIDGTTLITGSSSQVEIWDLETGDLLETLSDPSISEVRDLQLSADGSLLAVGGFGGALVWDMETKQVVHRVEGHRGEIDGIDLSPDGSLLITGSHIDQTTRLWELGSGRAVEKLAVIGAGSTIRPLPFPATAAFSDDGKRMATTAGEGVVNLWDSDSGELLQQMETGIVRAFHLQFNSEGSLLAVGGLNGAAVWDLDAGAALIDLFRQDIFGPPVDITFDPDETMVATASTRGVEIWPLDGGEARSVVDYWALVVEFSPDGTRLVVAGDSRTNSSVMEVRNTATLGGVTSMRMGFFAGAAHTGEVTNVAYTPDGRSLVSVGFDGEAVVWDTGIWRVSGRLEGHEEPIVGLSMHPNGTRAATASFDGTVRVWDLEGFTQRLQFNWPETPLGVGYSPDGKYLAVAPEAGPIQILVMDVDELLALARSRATRELTAAECVQYVIADCPSG